MMVRCCLNSLLILACMFMLSCCTDLPENTNAGDKRESAAARESETDTVHVTSKVLKRKILIPSELLPFKDVNIYPKVQGFVKAVYVDRGSEVKKGQLLLEIVAPELEANCREAEAKYESARSACMEAESKILTLVAEREEAEAKLQADEASSNRVRHAAQTEGAIAPADLEAADKSVQGDRAKVRAAAQSIISAQSQLQARKGQAKAAEQALASLRELKAYLAVKAPFDGIICERNVHEGSLVSPQGTNLPVLKIQELSRLRLIVPVPESVIAGVKEGELMSFTVPAFLGKAYSARVSRVSHVLDRKTRTMLVELDVENRQEKLVPGMYAEVVWEMQRPYETLFVPAASVLSHNDKTFVLRVDDGSVQLVAVKRGEIMDELVEIVGDVKAGDQVVLHAKADLSSGSKIVAHLLSEEELSRNLAKKHEE